MTLTDEPAPSVSSAQNQLGKPGGSQTFTIDVETGEILSVTTGPIFNPTISSTNSCKASDGCYTAPPPNFNYGFFGSPGTIAGSWSNRNGFNSGAYGVTACWVPADLRQRCLANVLPPGNRINFGTLVRGTSFTIHYLG